MKIRGKMKFLILAAAVCMLLLQPVGNRQLKTPEVFATTAEAAEAGLPTQAAETTGTWVQKGSHLRFRKADGKMAKNQFLKIDGKVYRFDKKKNLVTGWFKVSGKLYYGSKDSGEGMTGRLLKGWNKIDKKIYYFTAKYTPATGWKKIGGKRFYFTKSKKKGTAGIMYTGFKKVKGVKYFFRKTGKLGTKGAVYSSEWITVKDKKYYFNQNGSVNPNVMTEEEFIKKIGEMAREDMKKTGILASVTTAQAILESNYGTSILGMEAHNLFGMKATLSNNAWKSAWKGRTFRKLTWEVYGGKTVNIYADFRAYDTFAESLADHSAYLTGAKKPDGTLRYKGVVGCKKYKKAIQIIKNGGYATDPLYVSKIVNIIQRFKLTKYDK